MSPERWRRIESLFEHAAALPAGLGRETWLTRECGEDPELLVELCQRLAAEAPRRAGPYRLTTELGRGRMGTVYLGERDDGAHEGPVAVKVIRAGLDPRFLQAPARLEHPGIARTFDSGINDEGLRYIVMELVRGEPITIFARRKRLNFEQILTLYLEVCGAVSHAHAKLIVHGNLKPGKILVQDDGTPKLLGFEIYTLIEDAAHESVSAMTQENTSPERIKNGPISAAGDVYSLAAVLYEILTGRPPCDEPAHPASEVAHGSARAEELRGLADQALRKALAKNPEQRYQSVEEFAEDLRRVVNRELAIEDEEFIRGVAPTMSRGAALGLGAVALTAGLGWGGWRWLGVEPRRVDVKMMPSYLEAHRLLKVEARTLPLEAGVVQARRALLMFEQARLDNPGSALVQAGLAEAHVALAELEPAKFGDHMRLAQENARRGLALDDRLEDLHHSLAMSLLFGSWEPAKALEEFDRAVQINPRKSASQRLRADAYCMFGRFEEALAALDAALAVSPADTEIGGEKAWVYYCWRNWAEAERAARQTLAVDPNDALSTWLLGLLYQRQGKAAEAEKIFRGLPPRPTRYPLALAHLLVTTGRAAEAAPAMELVSRYQPNRSARALILAAQGDRGGALRLLEDAYKERDTGLLYVPMDPRYDALRSEPRFVRLFKQIGLPPAP